MGKHSYRAVDFQRLDWASLRERVAGERVIVAIDVAKEDFVAALVLSSRQEVAKVKWRHPQSTRALVEHLVALPASQLEAVMEPTGTYGDPLRAELERSAVAVYRINPKRVADAAEVYDGVPSLHDGKSACVLAQLHLEGVTQRWRANDERQRRLKALRRRLAWCCDREQRARNRLQAWLARHWPELGTIVRVSSTSVLRLLVSHGCPSAVAGDAAAVREQLRRDSGGGLSAHKIEAVLASAGDTMGVEVLEAEQALVGELADEVLGESRQRRALERELAALSEQDQQMRCLAQAVGSVSATVIYAELGDVHKYTSAGSYAKAAGLHLKERSSGKHRGELRITKRGPAAVRYYLYFAALRLLRTSGPARQWYEDKVARDGGRRGKAIVALMRKLARALWHVGHGEAFDVTRLFARPASA